jgi:hypothetical protein
VERSQYAYFHTKDIDRKVMVPVMHTYRIYARERIPPWESKEARDNLLGYCRIMCPNGDTVERCRGVDTVELIPWRRCHEEMPYMDETMDTPPPA